MHRIAVSIAVLAAIILGTSIAYCQRGPERDDTGVLSVLRKGQPVSVTEVAGRYEIAVLRGGPEMLGYSVVSVGRDNVVLEDIAHVRELRITIFSIKAVVVFKAVGKTGSSSTPSR